MNANDFVKAADAVCSYCIKRDEKTCETCPVRQSVDYYNKHRHSLVYNSIPKMTNNKIQSKVLLPGEKNKWPKEKTQQAIEEMIKNLEN